MKRRQIPEWVKPGVSFRVVYEAEHPNNMRYHVRALVDGRVVVRSWRRDKGRWDYEVFGVAWFHVMGPSLTDVKKTRAGDVV